MAGPLHGMLQKAGPHAGVGEEAFKAEFVAGGTET